MTCDVTYDTCHSRWGAPTIAPTLERRPQHGLDDIRFIEDLDNDDDSPEGLRTTLQGAENPWTQTHRCREALDTSLPVQGSLDEDNNEPMTLRMITKLPKALVTMTNSRGTYDDAARCRESLNTTLQVQGSLDNDDSPEGLMMMLPGAENP